MQFEVTWRGAGRKAQCAPNPKYPTGIDIDPGARPACRVEIPYPAPECGAYLVRCAKCDMRVMVTAAGRVDDPRSIMVPCRREAVL